MENLEKQYLDLALKFSAGDQTAFNDLWELSKRMINFNKYFDPSRARNVDDFEAVARIGLLKALNKFEFGRGNIISWCRNIMEQEVIKEVKKISRELPTNSMETMQKGKDTDKMSFEEKFFEEIKDGLSYASVENPDIIFNFYVEIMEKKLSKAYNQKVVKIFKMCIEDPKIMVKEIAKELKISSTMVSWYKMCIQDVYNKLQVSGAFLMI